MLVARGSRHHRRRQESDVLDRLTGFLRKLAAIASGQHRWQPKGRHHRHRASTSRGRPRERRQSGGQRAWLLKQQISIWQLGIVGCVFLLCFWVGWRIVTQTAALSLAQFHPDAALGFVADQSVALIRRAQQELVEPDGNLDSAREWAQRALRSSPLNARALTLLGLIAERQGDEKSADTLMRMAVA